MPRTLHEFLLTARPTGQCFWGETIDGRMSCIIHHHVRDKTPSERQAGEMREDAKMFARVDRKRNADRLQAALHQ